MMKTNQSICLLALFLLGSGVVFGIGGDLGRDAWLGLLLAMAAAVPLLLMYARTLSLFPGHDFYGLLRRLFGKWLGGALILLWAAYAVYRGAFLLRGVSEFFIVTTLPAPPWTLFPIVFTGAALYLLARGNETMGKWAVCASVIVGLVFVLMWGASAKDINLDYMRPFLHRAPMDFVPGSVQIATHLFLDCVLFLPMLPKKDEGGRPYAILLRGAAAAGAVSLLIILQNLLLLGEPVLNREYFPLLAASKIITVGAFLTRLETVVFLYIIFTGLTRLAVLLSAAGNGLSAVTKIKKPLWAAAPLALLCFGLSVWLYGSLSDVYRAQAAKVTLAGLLFQICIPLVLWLCAEWKARIVKF